jgi:hypothetical protein
LAALKISSDFCTVYAFSPLSTVTTARTTDRARRPIRALLGVAGRVEIPDATAAAAAPAILTGLCPLASKGGEVEVEVEQMRMAWRRAGWRAVRRGGGEHERMARMRWRRGRNTGTTCPTYRGVRFAPGRNRPYPGLKSCARAPQLNTLAGRAFSYRGLAATGKPAGFGAPKGALIV